MLLQFLFHRRLRIRILNAVNSILGGVENSSQGKSIVSGSSSSAEQAHPLSLVSTDEAQKSTDVEVALNTISPWSIYPSLMPHVHRWNTRCTNVKTVLKISYFPPSLSMTNAMLKEGLDIFIHPSSKVTLLCSNNT